MRSIRSSSSSSRARARRLWPFADGVALAEEAVAELAQLLDRGLVAVGEVGVAVAELLRQVELETLRELTGALDRGSVVGETLVHLLRCEQHRLVVAAPLALAAVERRAVADRDERVLQADARARVRMRVAGDDGLDAQRLREVAQRSVPAHVAALVRPLQLDVEAVAAEGLRKSRRRVRVANGEPVPRAAGEADEPVVAAPPAAPGRERAAPARSRVPAAACPCAPR